MTLPSITISNGVLCMDGGSVFLEATDAAGQMLRISLDWSISSQRANSTFLAVNGTRIEPGSVQEEEWIEALQAAHIACADDVPTNRTAHGDRIVLAPDAKSYLEAIDQGPRSALTALRNDVLHKLQSPLHRREASMAKGATPAHAGRQEGPLPLP